MLNQAQIIGNMTADPEIRTTPNGHLVASFSLATNRKYKDASWRKIEEVEFHNIVAWTGLAEIIEKYTHKGSKIFVQGRLHTKSWEDSGGIKRRYKTEIIAESVELLGTKRSEYDQWDAPEDIDQEPKKKRPAKESKNLSEEVTIEDIPF